MGLEYNICPSVGVVLGGARLRIVLRYFSTRKSAGRPICGDRSSLRNFPGIGARKQLEASGCFLRGSHGEEAGGDGGGMGFLGRHVVLLNLLYLITAWFFREVALGAMQRPRQLLIFHLSHPSTCRPICREQIGSAPRVVKRASWDLCCVNESHKHSMASTLVASCY